mmetsp:Transcript_152133/g.264483  ORF Transcript_152133/g.264483 Transcript_152133/m.264483 type:complete len:394 (+) Transcript_152133:1-1182(+)
MEKYRGHCRGPRLFVLDFFFSIWRMQELSSNGINGKNGIIDGAASELSYPHSAVPPRPRGEWKSTMRSGILFLAFAFTRAVHPTIITASKTKLPNGSAVYGYHSGSPVCLFTVLVFLGCQVVTLVMYGFSGWRSIWQSKPLFVFGVNGFIFAVDDWLEMQALGKMHGAAYQILSQSKILITACLMMPVKGVYQTRMQWSLLITLVCGMVVYMSIITSGNQSSGKEIPVVAYLFVVCKVIVSCMGSVYADKYAKQYSKVVKVPVQLVQMYLTRMIVFNLFVSCTTDLWGSGFFTGWDVLTWGVVTSFCVKGVFSYVILAVLDAILKNMAECIAVLLIFFYDVLAPWVDDSFDIPTFAAVMVVILVILSYIDSKKTVEKAMLYDVSTVMGRQLTP